jgi:hypothetical protein
MSRLITLWEVQTLYLADLTLAGLSERVIGFQRITPTFPNGSKKTRSDGLLTDSKGAG